MRESTAQHEWLATYDKLLYSTAQMQRVAILRRNSDLLPPALQESLRRYIRIRWFPVFFLLAMIIVGLIGNAIGGSLPLEMPSIFASGKCIDSGAEGRYDISVKGTPYTLQLLRGGQASLNSGNRTIGPLHWSLLEGPDGQMLEFDSSGEVYQRLLEISRSTSGPLNPQRGAVESLPECTRTGVLRRIGINYGDNTAFARTDGAR